MAIAFTACTNDDALKENSSKPVIVTAYVSGDNSSDARIVQGEPDSEGVIGLAWSANDTFSVIRGGENQTFTKASTGENDFTGTLPGTSGTCYAVYPQTESINNNVETAVPFIFKNQNGEGPKYLMYADSNDGLTYRFHHTMAYFKVRLPVKYKGEKVTVTLIFENEISLNGTIDLTDGTITDGVLKGLHSPPRRASLYVRGSTRSLGRVVRSLSLRRLRGYKEKWREAEEPCYRFG